MLINLPQELINLIPQELNQIVPTLVRVSFLVIIILIYWLTYNLLISRISKRIKDTDRFSWYRLVLVIGLVILSIFTTIFIFINNLAIFVGSLSVLSAALVFALQDFVAGFFAWLYIEISRMYKVNERIQITSDTRLIYGTVFEVGIFRTKIRELLGGDSLDAERPTGKIINFPNNYIFKYSLSNLSRNHSILWHSFNVVVSFDNDIPLAEKILKETVKKVFTDLIQNSSEYFDEKYTGVSFYSPKIYPSLASSGVEYGIWYGCRVGTMREVLAEYSKAILIEFEKNKIGLAYDTLRIIK